jgi:hypothetical protein
LNWLKINVRWFDIVTRFQGKQLLASKEEIKYVRETDKEMNEENLDPLSGVSD